MRYVSAMRGQLIETLGNESLGEHALTLFIGHLVSKGYGSHSHGRLRDYLMRGMRSGAKVTLSKLPAEKRPNVDLGSLDPESKAWLGHWKQGLLEHAWRALEQRQHKHPGSMQYSVLKVSQSMSRSVVKPDILAVQVSADTGVAVEPERVMELLQQSRESFAQILATEVANTLHEPTQASVAEELKALGLVANI